LPLAAGKVAATAAPSTSTMELARHLQ
jgi:hypothetical protein